MLLISYSFGHPQNKLESRSELEVKLLATIPEHAEGITITIAITNNCSHKAREKTQIPIGVSGTSIDGNGKKIPILATLENKEFQFVVPQLNSFVLVSNRLMK